MEWYHYVFLEIGITLIISIVIAVILAFRDKTRVSLPDDNVEPLPQIPYAEKIRLLKYTGLEHTIGFPTRIFYNETETKRLLFFMQEKGVLVLQEKLDVFSDEELQYSSCYGTWIQASDRFSHFYDSEDTAMKEWGKELHSYHEEMLDFSRMEQ